MKKMIAFIVMGIGFACSAFAQKIDSPQVKTANGIVQGVVETSGIHSFKGIPYAQPPVGDLRWKEPQSPKNWKGVLHTDHFGPQAMQAPIYSDMMFRSNGKSEDCLYLNVWTPAKSAMKRRCLYWCIFMAESLRPKRWFGISVMMAKTCQSAE